MNTRLVGNDLLKFLPPYNGNKKILVYDQNLHHVVEGIVKAADDYKNHYNAIWQFFSAPTVEETAKNVWYFLKRESDYVIEPDSKQTIKTPAAIIATAKKDKGGNDCKNFSLFTTGVLRSYREHTGEKFDLFLRFAGYNGSGLQHVFVVVKKNNKEIWIDPVLSKFDDRSYTPTKIKDYKIKNMALISLSGINPFENNKQLFETRQPVPGVVLNGPDPQPPTSGGSGMTTDQKIALGVKIAQLLQSLFGKKDAPGDYWKAWDRIDDQYGNPRGAQAQHWVMFDGDSVQNEALNILAYIRANGIEKVLAPNSTTKRDAGRYLTPDDLLNKLRRAGYQQEADEIEREIKKSNIPLPPGSTKAGMNMFITLALVGAAAFFLLKKRKA